MELQKYFNLEEYVDKIELTDQVLAHLQSTSKSFDEYFKILISNSRFIIRHLTFISLKIFTVGKSMKLSAFSAFNLIPYAM